MSQEKRPNDLHLPGEARGGGAGSPHRLDSLQRAISACMVHAKQCFAHIRRSQNHLQGFVCPAAPHFSMPGGKHSHFLGQHGCSFLAFGHPCYRRLGAAHGAWPPGGAAQRTGPTNFQLRQRCGVEAEQMVYMQQQMSQMQQAQQRAYPARIGCWHHCQP